MAILTDAIYWTAQPPQVQALQNEPYSLDKENQAATLATQGFTIDVPIMVYGWDPVKVMTIRQEFGYTWVPSALQSPPVIAPGISQPGTVSYDPTKPPAGSIKVSIDAADYPPFAPPVAPATPTLPLVGTCWGSICALGTGFPQGQFTPGYTVSENGKAYELNVGQGPMGPTRWLSPVNVS